MTKIHSFFNRLCDHPLTFRPTIMLVALLALAWSSAAFCGEIHDAAEQGDVVKVKTLLKGDPDLVFGKDDRGDTALHWAALNGHKDVVVLLLANKAELDAKDISGDTALHWAAQQGHKDVVELLLANKAEVDAKDICGDTALHWAALNGHKEVGELLLANKAWVDAKNNNGDRPLHWAAREGHKDVVELLLGEQGLGRCRE